MCQAQPNSQVNKKNEVERILKADLPTDNSYRVMKAFFNYYATLPIFKDLGDFFSNNLEHLKSRKVYATQKGKEKVLYHEVDINEPGFPYSIYSLIRGTHSLLSTFTFSNGLLKTISREERIDSSITNKTEYVTYNDTMMISSTPGRTRVFYLINNILLRKEYSFENHKDPGYISFSEDRLADNCKKHFLEDTLIFQACFSSYDFSLPYFTKYTSYQEGEVLWVREIKIDSIDAYHYIIYDNRSKEKKNGDQKFEKYLDIYLNEFHQLLRAESKDCVFEFEYEYYK